MAKLDRATAILCGIEVALWAALVYLSSHRDVLPTVHAVVLGLHAISTSVASFIWLVLFGHGRPAHGDLQLWHFGFLLVALGLQLVILVWMLRLYRTLRLRRARP